MIRTVSQKKNEFNQGVSVRIFLHSTPNKDGKSTAFLRIIIDRKKKEYNLKVSWPAAHFDTDKELALPRHSADKEVETTNMIINEAKGKANRIKLRYFADARLLTHELFKADFESYESRDNFLFYWKKKTERLHQSGVIVKGTYKRHLTSLKKLTTFLGSEFLSMGELNVDLLKRYDGWLRRKQKLGHNTVCGCMKDIRTYVNHATKDGFRLINPFEDFKFRYQPGERDALDRDELKKLRKLLQDPEQGDLEKEVLRKFLFSCYTSLRISDSALIDSSMIRQNVLHVATKKGKKFGKQVHIPLPTYAQELIEGRKGRLFREVADQTCNDMLKVIAHKADIHKKLTFHVSRDTFGTLFIELGGDVVTLKEIMGHTNIETTMIYVKMSEKRKEALMANFNLL